MVDMPSLVKCMEHITGDNTVTSETNVSEQLMVVNLTIGQSLLLIMPGTKEWLLALGTNKMFHMPGLTQCMYDSLLNGTSASTTDWYSHFIMASKAVQLTIHFSSISIQLNTARVTVKVVRMEGLPLVFYMSFLDYRMAFMAHILSQSTCLLTSIALTT